MSGMLAKSSQIWAESQKLWIGAHNKRGLQQEEGKQLEKGEKEASLEIPNCANRHVICRQFSELNVHRTTMYNVYKLQSFCAKGSRLKWLGLIKLST